MNEEIDLTFRTFPKMPRLSREIVITEKIDGTNAQILIVRSCELSCCERLVSATVLGDRMDPNSMTIFAGSRTRWITPGKQTDNYGFAGWVRDNATEIAKLGPGRHFGEWWGQGIQRHYELKEKRFSLFNVARWSAPTLQTDRVTNLETGEVILGVTVVPTLYRGDFNTETIEHVCVNLRIYGSLAAPGFRNPEGIIIFHTAAMHGFKKTLENDESPKSVILH